MRHVIPLAPALFLLGVALATASLLAGCADRGVDYAEVPNLPVGSATEGPAAAKKRAAAAGAGVAGYRGFCEEHGALTGLSTDEAGVDRVIAYHNAAYHRVAGSRFWVGEKITVA